jgi:replicative superfamily II helicase
LEIKDSYKNVFTIKGVINEELFELGDFRVPGDIFDRISCITIVADTIGKEDNSIVYANGPAEAEKIALFLSQLRKEKISVDIEIEDFIEFLKDNIHVSFPLVECLKFGVAFHYGNMPHLVRQKIEDLFSKNKIKYLVCTSTSAPWRWSPR